MESEEKFLSLYKFLKKQRSKKTMVFFSTRQAVKFYSELLGYINMECFHMDGTQKQSARNSNLRGFTQAKSGIFLCTDVAARGIDIPSVVCSIPHLSFSFNFILGNPFFLIALL